jgi:hypothetical protein
MTLTAPQKYVLFEMRACGRMRIYRERLEAFENSFNYLARFCEFWKRSKTPSLSRHLHKILGPRFGETVNSRNRATSLFASFLWRRVAFPKSSFYVQKMRFIEDRRVSNMTFTKKRRKLEKT